MRLRSSQRLLLDTNSLIYYLNGAQPYFDVLLPVFQRVEAGFASVVVSVISEAELLVGPMIEGSEAGIERIADLLSETGIEVIGVDRAIARRSAQLRAQSMKARRKPLTVPDAMIVATAIATRCDLVVGNDKEWKKLEGVPFLFLGDVTGK